MLNIDLPKPNSFSDLEMPYDFKDESDVCAFLEKKNNIQALANEGLVKIGKALNDIGVASSFNSKNFWTKKDNQ